MDHHKPWIQRLPHRRRHPLLVRQRDRYQRDDDPHDRLHGEPGRRSGRPRSRYSSRYGRHQNYQRNSVPDQPEYRRQFPGAECHAGNRHGFDRRFHAGRAERGLDFGSDPHDRRRAFGFRRLRGRTDAVARLPPGFSRLVHQRDCGGFADHSDFRGQHGHDGRPDPHVRRLARGSGGRSGRLQHRSDGGG